MAKKIIRFSAADRDLIRKHAIGKPTGVIASVGGFDLDLVPLTTEQAGEVFSILDAFAKLTKGATGDFVTADQSAIAELIATEGPRVQKILRSVLYESATANGLIDDEAVFDEWFGRLPLKETLTTLFPKVIEAQGLQTMLGNPSTPPAGSNTTKLTGI